MIKNKTEKMYANNLNIFIFLCPIIAIAAKLFEHLFLPEKYFYDYDRVCHMMREPDWSYAWNVGSYKVAADFFRKINIFGLQSVLQWSIFLGILLTVVVMIAFKICKGMNGSQFIFGAMCIALLNIYTFNISKDAIQFGIFCLIYLVIIIEKIPILLKAFGAAALLYWESNVYKSYYIIMAFFFVVIFIAFSIIRRKKVKMKPWHYLIVVVGLFAMVYVFLFAAKVTRPNDYNQIMEARGYSNHQGQTTVIQEPFEHNGNINIFFADYLIDSVRMMFPIEIVKNGAFYLPFFAFQLFMFFYVIRGIKHMNELDNKSFIAMCIFIGFFMGSVLFEPDFGSFVRHEAATFPVIILMVFNPTMWDPKVRRQIEYEKEMSSQMMQEEYTEV